MTRQAITGGAGMQRGVVLITGLVFMVVLTFIVLALMRAATLEERMASNARDRQLALQAAEAVLRDARETLFPAAGVPGSPVDPFDFTAFTSACTNGFCSPPGTGTPRWKTIAWTDTGITRSFAVPANSNINGVAAQPRYFIEVFNPPSAPPVGACPPLLFRITARGVGRDSATVFLESTVMFRPSTGVLVSGTCG